MNENPTIQTSGRSSISEIQPRSVSPWRKQARLLKRIVIAMRSNTSRRLLLTAIRLMWSRSLSGRRRLPDPVPLDHAREPSDVLVLMEDASYGGIPLRLFQTWKSRTGLPANYAYWSATLRAMNPDFEYVLWDDDDNRRYIAHHQPWFLDTYNAYPAEIFRADIIRPFFLFEYGGLYADMDTECLKPLENLLSNHQIVLGRLNNRLVMPDAIPNAIMASRPGEIFWLLVIAIAMEKLADMGRRTRDGFLSPEGFTGPGVITEAYDFYTNARPHEVLDRTATVRRHLAPERELSWSRITLLGLHEWYGIDWSDPLHALFRREMMKGRHLLPSTQLRSLFPDASIVTFWTQSWGAEP